MIRQLIAVALTLLSQVSPAEKPLPKVAQLPAGFDPDEYYVRPDGRIACRTCGGNCGQCGSTEKLGNIGGASMQRLAAHVEGRNVR